MEGVGRIGELVEQEADGRGVAGFHHLLTAEKHLADGVGGALHRQLFVDGADERGKGVVNADDFLAFDHNASA
jgi:hypothetical protein